MTAKARRCSIPNSAPVFTLDSDGTTCANAHLYENMPALLHRGQPFGPLFQFRLSSRFQNAVLIFLCVLGCAVSRPARGETETTTPPSTTSSGTVLAPIEPAPLEPSLPVQDSQAADSDAPAIATELSPSPRRFHYSLSFDFRVAYDDNITLSPINPIDDVYGRIEALVEFGFGDFEGRQENFLFFSYTPSYYFYNDNSSFNAFEHLARLDALYRFSKLTLSAIQDFQSVESYHLESTGSTSTIINGANIDSGGRRRLTTYLSRVNAAYDLSGKTSLSAGLDYTLTDYGNLINSDSLMATLGIDYKIAPKVTVGLAGSAGKDWVDAPSTNQTFEQVNLRASYQATGKITASASGGVEFRQFDGGTDNRVSPVFQVGVSYQPFEGTAISLNASGEIVNSAVLANQDYVSTQFTATIRQRLFQRVFVSVSGGLQKLDYFSTLDGSDTRREDNYYFIQPGIDVSITRYWTAGIYYLHRTNDSTVALFGFDENQFGVHSRITF